MSARSGPLAALVAVVWGLCFVLIQASAGIIAVLACIGVVALRRSSVPVLEVARRV